MGCETVLTARGEVRGGGGGDGKIHSVLERFGCSFEDEVCMNILCLNSYIYNI